MIEILKKRYKIGDTLIIHTINESFTGVIDAFEDTCVILSTEKGEEFITNDSIQRISVPKIIENIRSETPISTQSVVFEVEKKQEKVQIISEIKTLEKEETAAPKEYKVGDKIPLEELEKRSGKQQRLEEIKKAKQQYKDSNKLDNKPLVFSDPSNLIQLILPEIEAENKKMVSANGTISKYFGDRNFGFITDGFGYDIWFGFRDVIDDELLKILRGANIKTNIPVLFTLSKNYKGDAAIYIQKPKTVEQVVELAKYFFEKEGKADTALGLAEQILFSYPSNYIATNLKEEIVHKRFKQNTFKPSFKSFDFNYQKAVRAKNVDKNFDSAIKYYMLALDNNEKRESCIKDIAMLYVSMGETSKASDFITKCISELPNNITTYNYLENFFSSVRNFVKVIEYVDYLLNEKSILSDKRKHSMYLYKKGFAFIQIKKLEEAREVLEEAISIQSDNTSAIRLLQALDEPDNEELSQIIADAEFDSFGGGFSKFIKDTIENYDEYYGVPAKVLGSGDFSNETLYAIRKLIDTAGRARPRERANYLLTESKLMTSLEPEKENNLRSVLARYCNAMALNHISENSSMDVIRYFYLEAFNLEETYDANVRQLAIYLISFKAQYSELLSANNTSIDDSFRYLFNSENKDNVWEGILSMFLWNRSISSQITHKIFNEQSYREKSLLFLQNIGINTSQKIDLEEYRSLWNQAREKRQRDYTRLFASLKGISNNESLETLTNLLFDSLSEAKKNWLTQLDTSRLNMIASDIYDVLITYLRQSGYRDKERSYNFAKAQINQLIAEIKEKPTKFSYEGFIPLLEKMELLLEKSFKTVESASTPIVNVSILGEASVVGNDNIVPFQISVENSRNSSPIRDIKIIVENSDGIKFISNDNTHYDSIDGGEYAIFKLNVEISEKIVKDKAATIDIICEYKTRNQEDSVSIKEQLSLRLYTGDEFEIIYNPYAPIADGGPVTDKSMFYGRDEFINNRINAILNADSKQIIIYGQKRSGKSSVLHHLKQGLEITNRTFCISFSLGEIIRDLNEYTFYHKIIYGISRTLRLREIKGENIPDFVCPTEVEFKAKYSSNPANGFIELIEDFQIACNKLEDWKNRKLVVMIDEFTYLYTAIRNGSASDTIMKQWKAITQNESAKFSVVLVGQDVVPSFKKEDYAKNAFGVIEDIRLTYLDIEDARKLIEEPIISKNGESRFIGRAVDTIIDYTSRNPYYIQIFCARLVDYMNAKKIIRVTEADIKEVAATFIEGSQALAPEKFDNLIRAGEEHDFIEFDDEPIIKILRQISIGSKNIGICSRDNISLGNKELEDKILNHLVDREVLECKQSQNYKIQVKLFQEWLLRH